MPLFTNEQTTDRLSLKANTQTPVSGNRPNIVQTADSALGQQVGTDNRSTDPSVFETPSGEMALFDGLDIAHSAATIAREFIMSNAVDSVQAQATLLDWNSLRLLR
jgi:hypothetical protein